MEIINNEEYYTIDEVASMFNKTNRSVEIWLSKGYLHVDLRKQFNKGCPKTRLFSKSNLDAFKKLYFKNDRKRLREPTMLDNSIISLNEIDAFLSDEDLWYLFKNRFDKRFS